MPLSVAGFYSMMAQMESAGLLVGAWDHEFIGATRVKCRVYSLTDEGHRYVEAMLEGRLCFSTPKPPKRKSWLDRLVDWFALEDPDRD
jgi:DNA-binding PadR family transcriptional regulator